MKFKEIITKIKEYDYKKLLTSRNFIIAGSVLVIGIGVVVVSLVFGGPGGDLETGNESKKILGNPVLVDNNSTSVEESADETGNEQAGDSFFAISVINRQRVRDEALDVLREIADNPDTMPDTKEDALLSIASMVSEMTAETNIETLVKSKGFEECVAIISGGQCTVIVKSNELLADSYAQILEIVLESTNITAATSVKIIEK